MPNSELFLVADVGGTNVRFALVQAETTLLLEQQVYSCADHGSLADAIRHYLRQTKVQVTSACLALACPVNGDFIRFTNNHWSFSREGLALELGLDNLVLLNDFTAMALGMLVCEPASLFDIAAGTRKTQSPRVVVGPGTGLGFSALIPNGAGWIALATEGGHVGFVPRDSVDVQIMEILMQKHNNRVSAERLLCGQGLFNLYECLARIRNLPVDLTSPAEVSAAGLKGDDTLAKESLDRFFAHLGAYCGDMVLAYGALGGVYLCGGILPRMVDALQASRFTEQFKSKGRFSDFMTGVPVQLCLDEQPGLKGAAVALSGQHGWML